jgi:hypothetical protein
MHAIHGMAASHLPKWSNDQEGQGMALVLVELKSGL